MSFQSFLNFDISLKINSYYSTEEIESIFTTNFGARVKGITLRRTTDDMPYILLFSRVNGPYDDNIKGEIFYYQGEGLAGDQLLTTANKALVESINDDRPIYGFRQENIREDWKFIGKLEVVDYKYLFRQRRQVYEFLMKRKANTNELAFEVKEIKPEFISNFRLGPYNIIKAPRDSKKTYQRVDFGERNLRNSNTGKKGEALVLENEIKYLTEIGRLDLAEKVISISSVDDSVGYDILSFDSVGNEKYIEVKSTVLPKRKDFSFFMSANEKEVAERLKNYYLYLVFDVNAISPKIVSIKNPFALGLLITEPSTYIVKGSQV